MTRDEMSTLTKTSTCMYCNENPSVRKKRHISFSLSLIFVSIVVAVAVAVAVVFFLY